MNSFVLIMYALYLGVFFVYFGNCQKTAKKSIKKEFTFN